MIYNYIILLIIVIFIIILCYLFWINIIKTIDNKLKNINIEIKYPTNIENFSNNLKEDEKSNENKNEIDVEKINIVEYKKFKPKNKTFESFDDVTNGYNDAPIYKDWIIENKQIQVCYKNHQHNKDNRNTQCTYGTTNYADPHDMSPFDLNIHKLNYPSNMTLQDYINWLYCFIGNEDDLPYNHLKNLEKLKLGKELIPEEGVLPPPGYLFPSMDTKDYFDKMYNKKNEFNIASPLNSSTGPMLGYNYGDYIDFSPEKDMNGASGTIRNSDIGKKRDAKKLFNYINSRDSNNINIDNEYQIYRMKNVEI